MPARIERDDERAVFMFAYDADLIAEIKGMIAPRFRSYNPNTRAWTIREPMVDSAIAVVHKHCGTEVVIVDARTDDESSRRREETVEELRRKLAAETARAAMAERKFAAERAARIAERGHSPRAGATTSNGEGWAAGLYAALPEAMRDAVYKRLLAVLHPDTNAGNREAAEGLTKALNGSFRAPRSGR